MSTMQIGFFIVISIIFYSTSVGYCHPNESGINRNQSQELSRPLKRKTLGDVDHFLKAFENDEESLPDKFQLPLKRSINCGSKLNTKAKEEKKEPEAENKPVKFDVRNEMCNRLENDSLPGAASLIKVNPTEDPTSDKPCMQGVFRDIDNFFQNVDNNLKSLSEELSKIFNDISKKTSELLTQITNSNFLDMNKFKSVKNVNTLSTSIADMRQDITQMIPTIASVNELLFPLRDSGNVPAKISTCIDNIRKNVTEFVEKMKGRVDGANNFLSGFLNDMMNSVNPLNKLNLTVLDELKKKLNIDIESKNKTAVVETVLKQNAALGVLNHFLNKFTRGITGFFNVISRKWSHENKHPHHHGLVGSMKRVFGWPTHAHPEPPFFQRIFSLPNIHSKHHNEHVPLLKKIFKIPDHHHHHHHRHHHHAGSIIGHLLNSLYSIFHLTDHCECPQGSNSATSCPVNRFFNWLGGNPTPHAHHHKHAPAHINLHHNVMKHKQPACSCS